jgi:hypothetical protein
MNPVTTPPGRATLETKPLQIGSEVLLHECGDLRRRFNEHRVRSLFDHLFCESPHSIGITSRPTIVDPDVTAGDPAESLQSLLERGQVALSFRIIRTPHHHRELPHPFGLLRPRREGQAPAYAASSVMNSRRLI